MRSRQDLRCKRASTRRCRFSPSTSSVNGAEAGPASGDRMRTLRQAQGPELAEGPGQELAERSQPRAGEAQVPRAGVARVPDGAQTLRERRSRSATRAEEAERVATRRRGERNEAISNPDRTTPRRDEEREPCRGSPGSVRREHLHRVSRRGRRSPCTSGVPSSTHRPRPERRHPS